MIQVTGLTNDGRTVTILRGRAPPGLIRGAVLPVVAGSSVTLAEWDPDAGDNLLRVPDGSVGGDEGTGGVLNILVGFRMTCNGFGQWEGFQRCVPKMCVAASGGSLESPTFSLVSPGQLHSRSCPVGYDITCLLSLIALQTMAATNNTCVCVHPHTLRYEVAQEQKKARCSDNCLMSPMHTCRRYQCPLNQTKMHANQSSLYSREFYLNRSNHTYLCACHTDCCARMCPQKILLVSVCMRPNVCERVLWHEYRSEARPDFYASALTNCSRPYYGCQVV